MDQRTFRIWILNSIPDKLSGGKEDKIMKESDKIGNILAERGGLD